MRRIRRSGSGRVLGLGLGLTLGLEVTLLAGCGEAPADPPPPDDPVVAPVRPLTTPPRRLRRLSSREYDNVVRDLLGDDSRPAQRFVADVYQNGYDNGSAGLAVQSDLVLDYQRAAEALAAAAVKDRLPRLIGGCDVAAQGAPACADAFFAGFAPRAFRRPLSADEQQRLRAVFTAESAAEGFPRGIQTTLEVMLQSPQFLYREELGDPKAMPAPGSATPLTDYEIASQLSFLLTGSLPDDTLWLAVEQGRFKAAADYKREATRLLQSPSARGALRAFLHKWLATDRLANLSKDPAFYPRFNPAMAASMAGELDRYYDSVAWDTTRAGSLRELFQSSRSYADKTLGGLYGVPVAGAGFEEVALDPALRKGVLSRAGYLAVHAATDSSGPVSRGVFLLHSLLCAPPAQPPPNVPPVVPAGDPMSKNLTTRQRFEKHVANPFCASCHKQIDGVGFGFEQFDGIGAHRTTENGQPVDSRGTLIGGGDIDGEYEGVAALSGKLAGSGRLADCYVRQAYRYAMGQIEPDGEDLRSLSNEFSTDARMTDVLMAVIGSPLFAARVFEPETKPEPKS